MTEQLVHYSGVPVTFARNLDFTELPARDDKPHGLWVSVVGEDDWASWCINEQFRLDSLRLPYNVTLTDDANILRITTGVELELFGNKYGVVPEWARGTSMPGSMRDRIWGIDWPRLYREFDGIIIAPYQWSQRHGRHFYYYGWDCASGCIWDMNAIESFTAMPPIDIATLARQDYA